MLGLVSGRIEWSSTPRDLIDSLAGSLERFNRKERNLLVRAVLGHETKALELSGEFRKTVADALQIALIPPDAWRATDYHIAWLAGALAVYTEGADQAVAKRARPNPSVNGSSLVEGQSGRYRPRNRKRVRFDTHRG